MISFKKQCSVYKIQYGAYVEKQKECTTQRYKCDTQMNINNILICIFLTQCQQLLSALPVEI